MKKGEGDCDWQSDCCEGLKCDFDWGWKTDYCIAGPETKDYSWGEWSAWEICSVTCGGGSQGRNRSITQQAMFGGNECMGDDSEQQSCNNNGCPGRDYK